VGPFEPINPRRPRPGMLPSRTVLVSSSTNSGFPSVLGDNLVSSLRSGSTRPPGYPARPMLFKRRRGPSRPSVKVLTLGRPVQGGSNSARKVNKHQDPGVGAPRSTVILSNSSEGSIRPMRVPRTRAGPVAGGRDPRIDRASARERPAALLRGAERPAADTARRTGWTVARQKSGATLLRSAMRPAPRERFPAWSRALARDVSLLTLNPAARSQLGNERTKRAVWCGKASIGSAQAAYAASPVMRSARSRRKTGTLPIPGSPETSTTCPSPLPRRAVWRSSRKSISSSRPNEIGHTCQADRLEAVLGIGYALDPPTLPPARQYP